MTTSSWGTSYWPDLRRAADDPRPPAPLVLGIGLVVELVWAVVAVGAALPLAASLGGVVVIATVASWWLTVPSSLLMGGIAFLVADGFIEGQLGQLQWDGNTDVLLVLALITCGPLSAEIRSAVIESTRQRRRATGVRAR